MNFSLHPFSLIFSLTFPFFHIPLASAVFWLSLLSIYYVSLMSVRLSVYLFVDREFRSTVMFTGIVIMFRAKEDD